jgi:hypothetical protein
MVAVGVVATMAAAVAIDLLCARLVGGEPVSSAPVIRAVRQRIAVLRRCASSFAWPGRTASARSVGWRPGQADSPRYRVRIRRVLEEAGGVYVARDDRVDPS